MANKIHFRATVDGKAACATQLPNSQNKVRKNGRATYSSIPASCTVGPDEFRATPATDRCAHCCDQFTARMNARRALSGKPPYLDAFTKTLA